MILNLGFSAGRAISKMAVALLLVHSAPGWAAQRSAQKVFRQVEAECLSQEALTALRCQTTLVSRLPESIRGNYDRSGAREVLLDPLVQESDPRPTHTDDISYLERMRRHRNAIQDCRPAPEVAAEAEICRSEPTDSEEFELFVRLLRTKTDELQARVPVASQPFFRAYVAKCATSVSMNYMERESRGLLEFLNSRFRTSVEALWAQGKGECSEYAAVMTELGRSLGVPTWNVTTLYHEFNAVRLGDETLYLDAASPSCQFFRPD